MILAAARLRRYRSIEQTDEFSVESDVTCLVGKNESGKTAVLQALLKSHSSDPAVFDDGLDYPSRLTKERQAADGPIEVSRLVYQLSDADCAAVEGALGPGSLRKKEVSVTTGYFYKSQTWSVDVDESAVVEHLTRGLDLPPKPQQEATGAESVEALVEVLEALEGSNPTSDEVLETVRGWRASRPTIRAIDLLTPKRPEFVYFGQYDSMPGEVNIRELIALRDKDALTRGQRAFLALLRLSSVEPEDFLGPETEEHLVRSIENASNSISDEVFEYWSQNDQLEVQLRMSQEDAGPYPGPVVQVRVRNNRHRVSVPFDERSTGFVWFFSFLAYFSQIESEATGPIVLLLDEPGLNLHARAQADLLRFIDERLAPSHQVIYTTHSPFMVQPRALQRVRVVQDDVAKGTMVSSDVLKADNETAFPLLAALGIDLTQTLIVGPQVLLVEGPADVVFLNALSRALEDSGREGLDPRWAIVPAGSISKLPAFLAVFGSRDTDVAVLADSSSSDLSIISKLKQLGRLGNGGLVLMGEVLGRDEADLEDILTDAYYVSLVSDAYAGALAGEKLTAADLPEGPRIVKRVEEVFVARGINGGSLNHFAPARELMNRVGKKSEGVPKSTLEHAEILFGKINSFTSR
ncbi:AAA family ATPase [Demequina sp.]|uniref:AAA family ATPase n=1 Tax=Demequina sp. TaxID=2050685 RepID=UPI0025BF17E6|nr:AAA family ATPase [Demequina sp.]